MLKTILKTTTFLAVITLPGSARAEVDPVRDLAVVNAKLQSAVPFFQTLWQQVFAANGRHFDPPKVVTFVQPLQTLCGYLKPGNGRYCLEDNVIYLDASLLAMLMEEAAFKLNSDGDYAAIVVAAHEMGHAVRHQLGASAFGSFAEEQAADCLAGAATREAQKAGALEPGDFEEALYALSRAEDPDVIRSPLYERSITSNSTPGSHGSLEQRQAAFKRGFHGGAQSCTAGLDRGVGGS